MSSIIAQVTLDADGEGNTYELITSVLAPDGNPIEVPDCAHEEFGRHIDEVFDSELNLWVFRFFIHVTPDNDRCIKFDRQRNEIKTYDQSPSNLKGTKGETVEYKWKFRLDPNFQSSSSFTHIHQIKSVGALSEEESMPLITFTTRKGSPDKLELRYSKTTTQTTLSSTDLTPFKGIWVEATETIIYGEFGSYSVSIVKVSDGSELFSYSNNSIRMWKTNANFMRPKWGIYRSLNNSDDLRDEEVLFANFSITEEAKETTRPTVNLSTEADEPVDSSFSISITFNEQVSGFTENDINVSNGTIEEGSLESSDYSTYTATIIPTATGTTTIYIPENAAQDNAGNNNEASNEIIVEVEFATSANEAHKRNTFIYPNPSDGQIYIERSNASAPCELSIFVCDGTLIYRETQFNQIISLDLSHYKKGIYFIGLKSAYELSQQQFILK